jgi:glycerophosphoryl diester phosphodiesterase
MISIKNFTYEMKRPMILGHRGSTKIKKYPENTLPAFREAIELGADGIELDIRMTGDNQLVVFHDSDLSRLAGINLKLSKICSKELQDIKLLNQNEKRRTTIPRLRDVFESFGSQIFYNIEIKKYVGSYRCLIKELHHLLHNYRLKEKTWISSFDPHFLWQYGRFEPEIMRGFLFDKWSIYTRYICQCGFINIIHPCIGLWSFWEKMQQIKKSFCFWTVNDMVHRDFLKNRNILGIITDDVAKVRHTLFTE